MFQQVQQHSEPESSVAHRKEPGKNNTAGKLDIVLTHYAKDTLEETASWWDGFIGIEMVSCLTLSAKKLQNPFCLLERTMFTQKFMLDGRKQLKSHLVCFPSPVTPVVKTL